MSKFQLFEGSNEQFEVESFDEFLEKVKQVEARSDGRVPLAGFVFQGVDFSLVEQEMWLKFDSALANFWGCTFPPFITIEGLRKDGAQVLQEPPGLPFKQFRSKLYTQADLALDRMDERTYEWYLASRGQLKSELYMAAHDFSIRDALYDYLEGKLVLAVMGGHGLQQSDPMYASVARIGYLFSQRGYIVATGGGPGAMEAANLGAYFVHEPRAEFEAALASWCSGTLSYEVLVQKYGSPDGRPSLGVPTYYYGHEPSNKFSAVVAKTFSNAIREAELLNIAHGIVFTPGSAGTRQEIFQSACLAHYGEPFPLIFFGEQFWTAPERGNLFDVVRVTSRGVRYHELLLCTDDCDLVVSHMEAYRANTQFELKFKCRQDIIKKFH